MKTAEVGTVMKKKWIAGMLAIAMVAQSCPQVYAGDLLWDEDGYEEPSGEYFEETYEEPEIADEPEEVYLFSDADSVLSDEPEYDGDSLEELLEDILLIEDEEDCVEDANAPNASSLSDQTESEDESESKEEPESDDFLEPEEDGLIEEVELEAANVVVYNVNETTPFKGRTLQDVVNRYSNALSNVGTYNSADHTTWYTQQASTTAPYAAGVLTSDTHRAMTGMVNFYRWLVGVKEFSGVSQESAQLQAEALIRNFDGNHSVSSANKPADMPQEVWNAGVQCTHNILAPAAGGTPEENNPQQMVTRFLNEGYRINSSVPWTEYGIGHRLALIGATVDGMDFGYSGKTCVGKMHSNASQKMTGTFTAFPAPGYMTTQSVSPSVSAWHIQFDTSVVKADLPDQISVAITETSSGTTVYRTKSDNTLKVSDGQLLFAQPKSANYYQGEYKVVISGLTDVKTGAGAVVEYTIHFVDVSEQAASAVAKFTAHTTKLVVPESMATDVNLEKIRAALPDQIWAVSNTQTDARVSVSGGWTLDKADQCFKATVDPSTLTAEWNVPAGVGRTVTIPYTTVPDKEDTNYRLSISPSGAVAGTNVTFSMSVLWMAIVGKKQSRICRLVPAGNGSFSAAEAFNSRTSAELTSSDTYSNVYTKTVTEGDAGEYIGFLAREHSAAYDYETYVSTDTKTLKILISMDNVRIEDIPDQYYDGANYITPEVAVFDGDRQMVQDTDYTISYSNNRLEGTATVTIRGTGDYSGTRTVSFQIVKKPLPEIDAIADQTYNGSAIRPVITIMDGEKTLTAGNDYTVTYADNTNAGTATVTAAGRGNYSGTQTQTFTIAAKELPAIIAIANRSYTGQAQTPDVTIRDNYKILKKDTDYTVTYSDNTDAGTATVTAIGKGNYGGIQTQTFTIAAKTLPVISAIAVQIYTGTERTPALTILDGEKTLVNGTDYTVSYAANVNVGTATATATGKGNYSGTRTNTFRITAKPLPTISAIADQTYTGETLIPEIELKDGTRTLVQGTDYTVTCEGNTNVGTATVTAVGRGNYSGTQTQTFAITAKELPAISTIENQAYTGLALTPSVTIFDGSRILKAGTDYTVTYANNTRAGVATVTATGTGNYGGTQTQTFKITAKALPAISAIADQTYTGTEQTPAVTIKDGAKLLREGTDYTVAYEDNTNAGTATVTAIGQGDYAGTQTITFTIQPKKLPAVSTALIAKTYTGKAITQDIVIWDGDRKLLQDVDYTVTYSNNVMPGQASVTVRGIGNYGTLSSQILTFTILKASLPMAKLSRDSFYYTGAAIEPEVTVDGLIRDVDYTISYSDNLNAGEATVYVYGTGVYQGAQALFYSIVPKSLPAISAIADQHYTGQEVLPAITIKDGTRTLTQGVDYMVTYANNTDLGTATVTAVGQGNYSGTQTQTFEIIPAPLKKYTVRWSANGVKLVTGVTLPESLSVQEGDSVEKYFRLSAADAHTAFCGWSLTPNGNRVDTWNFIPTQDVTFYALWTRAYVITFHLNGGYSADDDGVIRTDAYTYQVRPGMPVGYPPRRGLKNGRKALTGWNTKADGSGKNYTEEALAQLIPKGDTTYYAVWKPTYEITWDANGGNLYIDEDEAPVSYTIVGTPIGEPAFDGWTRDSNKEFNGWSTTKDGKNPVDTKTYVPAKDMTLYAVWSEVYHVTFDGNGGTVGYGEDTVQTYKVVRGGYLDEWLVPYAYTTEDGYGFAGWSRSRGGTVVKEWSEEKITADTTFYAVWDILFTVTLAAGSEGYYLQYEESLDDDVKVSNLQRRIVRGKEIYLNTPNSAGDKLFAGYSTAPGGEPNVDYRNYKVERDVTLYAVWKTPYTVTIDANGGYFVNYFGEINLQYERKVVPGEGIGDPAQPYWGDGDKVFLGWSTASTGSPMTEEQTRAYVPVRDMVLYAIWGPAPEDPTDGSGTKPGSDPTDNPGTKPGSDPTDGSGTKPGSDLSDGSGTKQGSDSSDGSGTKPGINPADGSGTTTDTVKHDPAADTSASNPEPLDSVEKKLTSTSKKDEDVKGSTYRILQLRASKVKQNSITVKWNKVKGATGYILYGNQCGKKSVKLADTQKRSFRQTKLKKGKYYKYTVVAYKVVKGKKQVIASSKTIHVATAGGKVGNDKSVKVSKTKVTLKKGGTVKIKAKAVPKSKKLKVRSHRKLKWESSNPSVATVSASGKIKARKKGTCYIYVYAQSGVFKKIKVTVK